ncbi:hypothetical protein KGF57_000539 [Candida theae]|uniref:Cell wall protein PGA30 n=1 Tax=Candida theae TaxID=1198502 RepID=A0AAD5BIV8_9ASCO|nr:uncharacterized protein KGF57_000539 [Candida theae]KAI5967110.1 hypothetical protein KGF57_000539 [Candida theae]
MKFLIPASLLTLSTGALAAIRPVQFFASSDNEEVNGQGLYSTHEGAGINYFFLGAAQNLQYNDESRVVYIALGGNLPDARQYLAFSGDVLSLTVAEEPLPVDIAEDGTVTFPGSDALAAAKNINDPYRYSEDVFAVVKDGAEGSIPLSINAIFGDVEVEEPSASSSEEAPKPTDVIYTNATVTVFTTYCPEPTTLTLTVCETACSETAVTVSVAGEVTVDNVKLEATSVPAETSVASTQKVSTTVATQASTEASVYEGSAAVAGGAGLAAIAFGAAGLLI